MLEKTEDILERLRGGTLSEREIQELSQFLKQAQRQSIEQSGKFGVSVAEGADVHIGDVYHGVTLEQIRLIIQDLGALQSSHTNLPAKDDSEGSISEALSFKRLILDPTLVEAINAKLKIIEEICDLPLEKISCSSDLIKKTNDELEILQEIYESGCLSTPVMQDFRQIAKKLGAYSALEKDLERLSQEVNSFIQLLVEALIIEVDRLEKSNIKFSGHENVG